MVLRDLLSESEQAVLAKVAIEPQSTGELPRAEADVLIGRAMMSEVLGHYVITPKGQLELHRHIYRKPPLSERLRAAALHPSDWAARSNAVSAANSATGAHAAPLSKVQISMLRTFWAWLRDPAGTAPPNGK